MKRENKSSGRNPVFPPPSLDSLSWKHPGMMAGILFLSTLLGILSYIFFFKNSSPNQGPSTVTDEDLGLEDLNKKKKKPLWETPKELTEEAKHQKEIEKCRMKLEEANTREEVMENVQALLALKSKAALEALKMKLLNQDFQKRLTQMDFTGQLDVNNRPELVPSHRRLMRQVIDLLAKSDSIHSSDVLLTLIDSKVFYQPQNPNVYMNHLSAILAISQVRSQPERFMEVFRRILREPPLHKYSKSEKQWALAGLRNLKRPEAFLEIVQFTLQDQREESEALLGVQTLLQTNEKEDLAGLKQVAMASPSPRIREACYKALAGIPGPQDSYGFRLTARREYADLEDLENLAVFFKDRLLREEQTPQILPTLRRSLRRILLLIDQRKNKQNSENKEN